MKQFNDMEHSLQFNFHRGVAKCFTIKLFFQRVVGVTGINYNKLLLERHEAFFRNGFGLLDLKRKTGQRVTIWKSYDVKAAMLVSQESKIRKWDIFKWKIVLFGNTEHQRGRRETLH